jgi:hypothetical protein
MPQNHIPSIYSHDIDELLTQMPSGPLRWGISLMFGVVLLLLGLSWFIKYPDVIKGTITISTNNPPAMVVARASGPLHLFVNDKAPLQLDEAFAVVGGTTRYEDYVTLKNYLNEFAPFLKAGNTPSTGTFSPSLPEQIELGELQEPYNSLLLRWKEWQGLAIRNTSNQKRKYIVNEQIGGLEQISTRLGRQLELQEHEYSLLLRSYEKRYRPLQQSGGISIEQLEAKRDELINKEKEIEATRARITENENRIIAFNSQKIEYDFNQTDQQLAAQNALRDAYTKLTNALAAWQNKYVLKAPIKGRLNYLNFLHENSLVVVGQEVAGIVPPTDSLASASQKGAVPGLNTPYIGELYIESSGAGKVEVGQTANINLLSFSKKEFGMLRGRVATVADISTKLNAGGQPRSVYKLYVSLPSGLVTTTHKKLPFRYGMEGDAEVITKDIRVIERIFDSISSAVAD